jgi:hypothetical protein
MFSPSKPSGILKLDNSAGTIIYIGEAAPGVSDSDTKWRIKKLDTSTGLVITWASGTVFYDKQWTQRVSYTYS